MSRLTRKDEHIVAALKLSHKPALSGFEDITLVHNALPEIAVKSVTLTTNLFGKTLNAPIVINAITGGGELPKKVNESLAMAARETGVAMAVGSQTVAMERPEFEESFKIVRQVNPDGLIFANISAGDSVETALRAVDMISADALQLHLNVPQEIEMREGDIDFRGWIRNISNIVKRISVPIIIKEVGFGLSYEVAQRLNEVGVKNFDTGGRGGTNFIVIERLRKHVTAKSLDNWGIATAASVVEINRGGIASTLIATGGITNGLDVARALSLGADAVGIAGSFLKVLFQTRVNGLIRSIDSLISDLKKVMVLVGAEQPSELKNIPVVITGKTKEWLNERGIDTTYYARRNKWNNSKKEYISTS